MSQEKPTIAGTAVKAVIFADQAALEIGANYVLNRTVNNYLGKPTRVIDKIGVRMLVAAVSRKIAKPLHEANVRMYLEALESFKDVVESQENEDD